MLKEELNILIKEKKDRISQLKESIRDRKIKILLLEFEKDKKLDCISMVRWRS